MPNASAPNAPCVAVCESPQTIVMPGWVTPELRADHVHDALALGAERVDGDAELRAVALERLDLHARELVADARGDRRAVGRHVVVGGGERAVRPAHRAAGEAQAVERLRARDLVDEVQVDVEQARRATSWASQILSNSVFGIVLSSSVRPGGDDGEERGLARVRGSRSGAAGRRRRSRSRPRASSWRSPSQTSTTRARARRRAVSRLPGSCIGGSSGAAGRARRARACGARARRAGRAAAAVSTS